MRSGVHADHAWVKTHSSRGTNRNSLLFNCSLPMTGSLTQLTVCLLRLDCHVLLLFQEGRERESRRLVSLPACCLLASTGPDHDRCKLHFNYSAYLCVSSQVNVCIPRTLEEGKTGSCILLRCIQPRTTRRHNLLISRQSRAQDRQCNRFLGPALFPLVLLLERACRSVIATGYRGSDGSI